MISLSPKIGHVTENALSIIIIIPSKFEYYLKIKKKN